MSNQTVQPRILKGFRDYTPETMLVRTHMLRRLETVFQRHGFLPIDTPALEYAEILLGKGSDESDKQLYRFSDLGGRDIALRFDLTVPLARFVAMHVESLGLPFRRYHIGTVWRAEKPQRGRYREFLQCDFDILGASSIIAEADILLLMQAAFASLDVDVCIRVNHRGILNALTESLPNNISAQSVLRIVDKLEKLGEEAVRAELKAELGLDESSIEQILRFIRITADCGDPGDALKQARASFGMRTVPALDEMEELFSALSSSPFQHNYKLDFSIARGLDYYTGVVFETNLPALPDIGSVCSGGRYDNLVAVYSKRSITGVGASIGIDRLIAALEQLDQLPQPKIRTVLFCVQELGQLGKVCSVIAAMRKHGISAELFPSPVKLKAALKFANRSNIPLVVFCSQDEATFQLKEMTTGAQHDQLSEEALLEKICALAEVTPTAESA